MRFVIILAISLPPYKSSGYHLAVVILNINFLGTLLVSELFWDSKKIYVAQRWPLTGLGTLVGFRTYFCNIRFCQKFIFLSLIQIPPWEQKKNWKFIFFFSDKMKDTTVAKLASQTHELYSGAYKLMQKDQLRKIWDRHWLPRVSLFIHPWIGAKTFPTSLKL